MKKIRNLIVVTMFGLIVVGSTQVKASEMFSVQEINNRVSNFEVQSNYLEINNEVKNNLINKLEKGQLLESEKKIHYLYM
ncbi:hypothetical protein SAMN00017477_0110 [Peptoniphilus asaccharolyticus DSM 20463]|uniref:Uncharacterized protein n=1 Tax=Peptoniphilus asaccharolyticus DSM 20463 TaxID=573058 RepID=A0A1W1UDL1_PEPAS|nr:hypothetical protein [Peptoniphilus asaccharolyticus]MBL7576453.1 hypothetical protein [Peptoniphilus asaccharolyticus]SMB78864.1 hypothetical protein SAMN00017477_0110 [Peptoniphilus asaccharolyticus DSM 20463]